MNFLIDLIPAAARKWVYGILSFATAVYGIWQATDGNWAQFAAGVVTALVSALATANTNVPDPPGDHEA